MDRVSVTAFQDGNLDRLAAFSDVPNRDLPAKQSARQTVKVLGTVFEAGQGHRVLERRQGLVGVLWWKGNSNQLACRSAQSPHATRRRI